MRNVKIFVSPVIILDKKYTPPNVLNHGPEKC